MVIAAASVVGARAHADPGEQHVIRLSSIAPEGTGYARELKAMANETLAATQGRVRVKLYLGAVAGDELQARERMARGQLDAVASAAMLCEQLSPAMRVMRLPGLFRSREEAQAILTRLQPTFNRELMQAGYRNLGSVMVGPVILFSREPARTLNEMRQHTYWIWDADKLMPPVYPVLGFTVLPLPINDAAHAYEQHRHDGFIATPVGALAFQWSTMARYYLQLPLTYLVGCVVVANRAYDELAVGDQQALSAAAAKAAMRIDAVGRDMDAQLLGGLFEKQGLHPVAASPTLQVEYEVNAARARAELTSRHAVDPALVGRVEHMLGELRQARAEH